VFNSQHAAPSDARCVADIKWLLQSPALLSLAPQRFSAAVQAFSTLQSQRIDAWLTQLDASHLQSYVAQALPSKAPMRLGRYAERLMEYALRHCPLFELLAANVPLRSNLANTADKQHTTIGEFDYLLRDDAGVHWHWELAVKFYLCHTSLIAQPHDFKGPAGKDTLGLKLSKVFDRQLKHLPPAPYDKVDWQPAAYARGWLFYPFGTVPAVCDMLNPRHLQGWWLAEDVFESSVFQSAHFVHLPRLHWLAPYALNELPVLSQSNMAMHLAEYWKTADSKQKDAGQLLACVVQGDGVWQEVSRGFVMPALIA
jgi:hypothetical protein